MRTVLEVVRLSTTYLDEHGSGTPRLDAELLASHALGIGRIDLYLQHDRPLADPDLTAIRTLVRRRGGGEPVAHLLGRRDFYGRSFVVSPAVLIPRPDTEALVEVVLGWARAAGAERGEGPRIADLGTGSGCIACTLAAELPGARVLATDVSAQALEVAAVNAHSLGVADRDVLVEGSWGDALAEGGARFDVVVSNPPYVATGELAELAVDVRDHEPQLALDGGPDGLIAYAAVLETAERVLRPGGLVAVEVDPRRADAVAAMMRSIIPRGETATAADLTGRTRVVHSRAT
ncbi:MAG: peptide chain release factor N(5)-glutamine methyltransferase [Candidatus Dormibacteria bacterium]